MQLNIKLDRVCFVGIFCKKSVVVNYLHRLRLVLPAWAPLKPTQDSSEVVLSAVPENVAIATSYFDVTGRPLQNVVKQASPSKKDMVSFTAYDQYGRLTRQHMPYAQQTYNTNDGKFKDSVLLRDSLFYRALFPGDSVFYTVTKFDASPLQRVLKASAQGDRMQSMTVCGCGP